MCMALVCIIISTLRTRVECKTLSYDPDWIVALLLSTDVIPYARFPLSLFLIGPKHGTTKVASSLSAHILEYNNGTIIITTIIVIIIP